MSWIRKAEWQVAEPDALGPSAAGMIAHMNTGYADALVLYCKAFSKATEVASATMRGIDRYGFEMSAKTKEGPRPVRLAFAKPVSTPAEARGFDRDAAGRQGPAGLKGAVAERRRARVAPAKALVVRVPMLA